MSYGNFLELADEELFVANGGTYPSLLVKITAQVLQAQTGGPPKHQGGSAARDAAYRASTNNGRDLKAISAPYKGK
ncbi:MAG: hypothetical protein LBJ38_03575 [Oscillospiraceae bacterium]|jgi:hypothetical protein|nr:hypothetical protein [Oscillospiraceae bacterium]